MRLTDISTTRAVTCRLETTIHYVAGLMADREVSAVIVVSETGHVVGIVTDRDLVVRGLSRGVALRTPVSAVMTSDVGVIRECGTAAEAMDEMAARACRRLPVVDDRGRVVGLVTANDIRRHLETADPAPELPQDRRPFLHAAAS